MGRVLNMSAGDLRLAWAAGFIDGEGYVGITWSHRFVPVLSVGQKRREPIDELDMIFRVGNVKHYRGMYTWIVSKRLDIHYVLSLILPYVVRKKHEVVYMLEYLSSRITRAPATGVHSSHNAQELELIIAICQLKGGNRTPKAQRMAMSYLLPT